MLIVFKQILPKLPKEEEYDLKSQLRRSSKAVPRLIADYHGISLTSVTVRRWTIPVTQPINV